MGTGQDVKGLTDDFVLLTADEGASIINVARQQFSDSDDTDMIAGVATQAALKFKIEKIRNEFAKICPPLYLDTDVSKFPADRLDIVMPYNISEGKGLFLHGDAGSMKTRMMWYKTAMEFARRHGKMKIVYVEADEFAVIASSAAYRYDTTNEFMGRVKSADLLLFDDVFKCKMNEMAETMLFGMINSRMEMNKPTIYTSNVAIKDIPTLFSDTGKLHRAEPLMRRLGETCKFVEFRRK